MMLGQKIIINNKLLNELIEPLDINKYIENENENKNENEIMLNIKKNNFKYKNDENIILNDYNKYINNNELFVVDVYNDLGSTQFILEKENIIKNIYNTYIKLYYHDIDYDKYKYIIMFLNKNKNENINENINER